MSDAGCDPIENRLLTSDLHIQAAYRLTEALVTSEKVMRRRIDLISEIVFELDGSGKLLFLNQAWINLIGSPITEALGQPLSAFVHRDDHDALAAHFAPSSEKHSSGPLEIRLVSTRGHLVWMEMWTKPLDEGGWVGNLHDISERIRAEAEMARLSLVASYTDSLVIITGSEGQIEWVNNAFTQKTGFRIDECAGLKPGALLQGAETDPKHVATIRDAIRETRSFQVEILNYTKSGEPYWVAIYGTPVFDELGNLERYISVQNDITAIRQMQQELAYARDEAEEASQAKSIFLASISHEIRTPLNGILGMVSLMEQGILPDHQRQRAEIIRKSSESLITIVNDVLDYSKIQAGRFSLRPEPFCLAAVLDDVVNLLRGNAEAKGLELTAAFHGNRHQRIVGDQGRLLQVVMNLVSNALKFTAKGQVSVDFTATRFGEIIGIECHVRDTGIGIAGQDLKRLFVHFSQLDGSSTRNFGGTGLGLAICKQLIEMMGGDIGVESEPGVGSDFWFRVALPADNHRGLPDLDLTAAEPFEFDNLRILVAEDNEVNQLVLEGMLSALNCHVEIVENGREAVLKMMDSSYDVILMDVHMPVMDGLEATHHIRLISDVPVIAVTASVMPEHIEMCQASGMSAFVAKPFSAENIKQKIAQVVGTRVRPDAHSLKS